MCRMPAGHSSRPDPWSIQQESHQADLGSLGTAGDSANVAAGGTRSRIGWTPLQGFVTDPEGLETGLEGI